MLCDKLIRFFPANLYLNCTHFNFNRAQTREVSQHSEEDDEEEEEEEEDAQPTRRRKRLSIQELRRLSGTKKGKK